MNKGDLFIDMPVAYRLSCQSIHRLVALGNKAFRWQEETLTEILIGHLSGMDYTVEADCPQCGTSRDADEPVCGDWNSGGAQRLESARIRLLNKKEEGGPNGLGSDFLFSIEDHESGKQVRLLIQAKKIRSNKDTLEPLVWKTFARVKNKSGVDEARAKNPDARIYDNQFDQLVDSARECSAEPYYLFFPEKVQAHHWFSIACPRHRTPEGTAAVLVHAEEMKRVFEGKSTVCPSAVLAVGRSLMCLAEGGRGAAELKDFHAALAFIHKDRPDYAPCPEESPTDGHSQLISTNEKIAVARRTASSRSVTRSESPGSYEILAVYLGDWKASQPGDDRDGHGWREGITSDQLRESTRRYWRVAKHRAAGIRYLVALRRGQALAVYRVIADPIRYASDKRFEFIVEDLASDDPLARNIMERAEVNYQRQRPYGQPFGYP